MWDLIVSVPDHCLSFYFRVPEESPCNIVMTLWNQWSQHEILKRHNGTSGSNKRYCYNTGVPVEPPRDTVMTLGYRWVRHEVLL